jgi:hypothetical protein
MTALARKLKARGHETMFFGVPDAEPAARTANLGFASYGERELPCGGIEQKWSQVARLQGDEVLRYTACGPGILGGDRIQADMTRSGVAISDQTCAR